MFDNPRPFDNPTYYGISTTTSLHFFGNLVWVRISSFALSPRAANAQSFHVLNWWMTVLWFSLQKICRSSPYRQSTVFTTLEGHSCIRTSTNFHDVNSLIQWCFLICCCFLSFAFSPLMAGQETVVDSDIWWSIEPGRPRSPFYNKSMIGLVRLVLTDERSVRPNLSMTPAKSDWATEGRH